MLTPKGWTRHTKNTFSAPVPAETVWSEGNKQYEQSVVSGSPTTASESNAVAESEVRGSGNIGGATR